MPKLLNDDIVKQINDIFVQQLKQPVELLFFGQKQDCDYCSDTRQLLEELTAISDKLSMRVFDMSENEDIARQYHVSLAPGLVIAGKDGDKTIDYGIRFAGIPSGHEFSTLIQTLITVSERDSGLDKKTREALTKLQKPALLQVFVTPT